MLARCHHIILLIYRLIRKETNIFILDDILFAPLNGLIFVAKKINDVVEKETSDEGTVKERLMALQLRFELDEINEEEYDREEDDLLRKLEQIRVDKQSR
ncbi:MAG: gas vesicle protein GvpG [Chlorobium sp.]|nr:MAG: gas vesicle protein GvpG [Chlorobium sp.]